MMDPDLTLQECFVENIRYFMDLHGISQADVARAMDVSTATASDWCTGKKFPRNDKLEALASLLHVSTIELLSPDGKEKAADRTQLEFMENNPDVKKIFDLASEMETDDRKLIIRIMNRMLYGNDI